MEENNYSHLGEKLKILFLFRPTLGGIQSHLLDIIRFADKNKFSIFAAGPYTEYFYKEATKAGAEVKSLKIADKINFFEDIKTIIKLRRILRRLKPDIIHIHGNKANFIAYFACMGIPLKKVITFHNFQRLSKGNIIVRKVSSFINRRISKGATMIAVSHNLKKELVEVDGFNDSAIEVIHNGIDTEKFKFDTASRLGLRKELNINENEILIGFIGRFTEQKNPLLFIDIARRLVNKKIKFLMVGDGPLKNDVINEIKNKGLTGSFSMLNFVENVNKLYCALDIFIFPSKFEPFGIVALEALSCNVPIVASMVGGIPEIIKNGENGFLFNDSEMDDAAEKVLILIRDEGLRKMFIENGRKKVRQDFSIESMIEKTFKIYKNDKIGK